MALASRVLAHAGGPELDAYSRPDRSCGFGNGVLPSSLAAAAHDEQVTMTQFEAQRLRTLADRLSTWTQLQRARLSDREDRHHCVLGAAPADRVAVPGNAVAPVAVVAQSGGDKGLAQFAGVVLVERLAGLLEERSGNGSCSP